MKLLTVCCTCLVLGISGVANAGGYTYNTANDVIISSTAYDTVAGTVNPGGYSYDWAYVEKGELVGSIYRAYSGATLANLNNTTTAIIGEASIEVERTFTFVPGFPGETPVANAAIRRWGSYAGSYNLENVYSGTGAATATQTALYSVNRGGTSTAATATNTLTRTNTNGASGANYYGATTLQAGIESVAGALTITKKIKVGSHSTASGTTSGGARATANCAVGGGSNNEISILTFNAFEP